MYNFFINIKKTPYSIGPDVNMEYFKKPLQEIFISSWLLFGRLCSIYFIYLIYKNWKKGKILCLFSLLILASVIFYCMADEAQNWVMVAPVPLQNFVTSRPPKV